MSNKEKQLIFVGIKYCNNTYDFCNDLKNIEKDVFCDKDIIIEMLNNFKSNYYNEDGQIVFFENGNEFNYFQDGEYIGVESDWSESFLGNKLYSNITDFYKNLSFELQKDDEIIKFCLEKCTLDDISNLFKAFKENGVYDSLDKERFFSILEKIEINNEQTHHHNISDIHDIKSKVSFLYKELPVELKNDNDICKELIIKSNKYHVNLLLDEISSEQYLEVVRDKYCQDDILSLYEKTHNIDFIKNMETEFKKQPEFIASIISEYPINANKILEECYIPKDVVQAIKEMPEVKDILESQIESLDLLD